MKLQRINNFGTFGKGLYFTATKNILFDKQANFLYNPNTKVTKEGAKYIQDLEISKNIKKKFASTSLIKSLSKKYDTFIEYKEFEETGVNKKTFYTSIADIIWRKDNIVIERVCGCSEKSIENATDIMFNNLKKGFTKQIRNYKHLFK